MSEREPERLEQAIAELVAHAHDDLPDGPSSDLGGEVRSKLIRTRSEQEFEHLAARGKALVESRLDKRKREAA